MTNAVKTQRGFIPLIISLLLVLIAAIVIVFIRVHRAQQ
jgi:hypothetical protein